jgi:hypothetical protein
MTESRFERRTFGSYTIIGLVFVQCCLPQPVQQCCVYNQLELQNNSNLNSIIATHVKP